MTNLIKTISITLLIALSMSFISCKNDETDPNAGKFKNSDLVGTWTGDAGSFTIDSSGYVNFTYQGTTYNDIILRSYIMEEESLGTGVSTFESGYSDSATHSDGAKRKSASFFFSSSSSCDVTIMEQTYSGTYPNGEWQTQNTIKLGTFTK
ncbi:hypothetical protein [Brachyspira catarrhinii]|uniref:Lipocalin-like domain-containing protein n=1 Tax=Brachyspira catarrhinii TaxID=2528966 RepID=A0ABY2TNW8_9SPIR|nr:hypothetical protein [Brachyspira catarrhinii]TKZ31071.1 hypothetical protein EZH24_10090 [Brachyspira catarrhinii]